jgi:hypothetical protein
MLASEYIDQQIKAGKNIHFHQGVWWQKFRTFFYKPVLPMQKIVPGEAKPHSFKSLLGYSHLVTDEKIANRHWSVMLMRSDKLQEFSLKNLPDARRRNIRKGLRLTEIKKIVDIDAVIKNMRDICIATANRTQHGKAAAYYVRHFDEWQARVRTSFAMPQREWWGAYFQGSLIAYFYCLLIEDTMFIEAIKSHTDFLDKRPNDALMFAFLDYCRTLPGDIQVIGGDWCQGKETLNKYKESFGFERVDLPKYIHCHPLVLLASRLNLFV